VIFLSFDIDIGHLIFWVHILHGVVFSVGTFGAGLAVDFEVDKLGNLGEIGPGVGGFFGKNELRVEHDLEGADGRKGDILIGLGVKILVLCGFDGQEIIRNDIALDKEVGGEVLLEIVFD
jgi:hypothetical protein